MDAATLRLLFRLSLAVVVLVFSLVSIAAGVELPLGRGGRALPVLVLLGSVVAILLIAARLRGSQQPGTPLASLPRENLLRRGIRRTRELSKSARARSSAALHRRRRAARVRQAELAAREASRDCDRLAPERIRTAAEALLRLVYLARDARDPKRLATLMSPELLAVWERELNASDAAGAHEVLSDVKIDLVGLAVDAAGAATVIVLIEAELHVTANNRGGKRVSSTNGPLAKQTLCQYWTLALDEGPLTVRAIEERRQGDHHLTQPLVIRAVH